MNIELTIIRLKETREPVAVLESIGDIVRLGGMIDEITDPNQCEYADIEISLDFSLFSLSSFPKFMTDEDSQFDCIGSMRLSDSAQIELMECFTDNEVLWAEMPTNFDYVCSGKSLEDRFIDEGSEGEGDLF